jgi:hypothetical protein
MKEKAVVPTNGLADPIVLYLPRIQGEDVRPLLTKRWFSVNSQNRMIVKA